MHEDTIALRYDPVSLCHFFDVFRLITRLSILGTEYPAT